MEKYIDIKLGDCLIKNVPTYESLPNIEIIAYMNHQGIYELEYKDWQRQKYNFIYFKESLNNIRQATRRLSDMGFNKEFLMKQVEGCYDNYEKEKQLSRELDELN